MISDICRLKQVKSFQNDCHKGHKIHNKIHGNGSGHHPATFTLVKRGFFIIEFEDEYAWVRQSDPFYNFRLYFRLQKSAANRWKMLDFLPIFKSFIFFPDGKIVHWPPPPSSVPATKFVQKLESYNIGGISGF